MKAKKMSLLLLPLAAAVVALAVWGPEELARYRDEGVVSQIKSQESGAGTEGYRYSLSSSAKIYILSECLNQQVLPESDLSARTKADEGGQEPMGTYAFVENKKSASGQDVSKDAGIELCNQGIRELKEMGIWPQDVQELDVLFYSAELYSAIDVPEPRNNVLVWKISLDEGVQNVDKAGRLLDAYVDADTGKIYEFYIRTAISSWEEVDADRIISSWAQYMEIEEPQVLENTNPLAENTPYFKKYSLNGVEDGTVVTVGFYEGINELYLKISE